MTHTPADQHSTPAPAELREQIEHTRHELGDTVQALADKTDVKARARQKAGQLKDDAVARAGELKVQATKATSRVQDKLPDSFKQKAAQAAGQARATATQAGRKWEEKAPAPLQQKTAQSAQLAREHRTLLLTVAAGIAVLWLASRIKKD
ncbi:DUF3618 domain-containing protein [Streptomyces rhizosphaerihabitans]|uniref:DUF3618 domain-containing protein n=1 Tax=Streptomyces rhizosphaerihabitans TaxID=1266770 RepID=UPI0021BF8986|nr:DUF3618 domain-containing protein [Streptomyces rhizosphaerihabitans]MCT9011657.1 DUF3618 domain-containing protein [Streptomyces rhizosphaerihabitans]